MNNNPLMIIGANGQLGRELVQACRRRKIDCQATPRHAGAGGIALDLASAPDFNRLLDEVQPGCVLNAAAYTAVDRAESEPHLARQVNAVAPGRLARACRQRSIPLIHFSTDYVFSGHQRRAYREDSPCAPLNVYGQTKAEGEQRIRDQGGCYYIFRSSWLYSPGHSNFVSTMLRLFTGEDPLRVVDDQHGCPTWTHYLADAVLEFLHRRLRDRGALAADSGTYHLCARGHCSWHAFARAIADRAQPQPRTVPQPIASHEYVVAARRPAFSVLDCHLAETRLGMRLPHWRQQINEAMALFNSNPAPPAP